jgi:hypothetical protein
LTEFGKIDKIKTEKFISEEGPDFIRQHRTGKIMVLVFDLFMCIEAVPGIMAFINKLFF